MTAVTTASNVDVLGSYPSMICSTDTYMICSTDTYKQPSLTTGDMITSRYDGGVVVIPDNYVEKDVFERELKSRDERIRELEDRIDSLARQLAKMLRGDREGIDDNVLREEIKMLFEE